MRHRVRRLRELTREQWAVVVTSLGLVPLIRVSLRRTGFAGTARLLAARSRRSPAPPDLERAARVTEAVGLVARRSPFGGRCLERSLAAWFLLRRRGIDAELVVGAGIRGSASTLPAHAWIEVEGEPVNEDAGVRERFGRLDLRLPRLTDPS